MTESNGNPLLIGIATIADIAGVRQNAVSNWRKRHSDFPKPVTDSPAGMLFEASEVERWLIENGKTTSRIPASALVWPAIERLRAAFKSSELPGFVGALLTLVKRSRTEPAEPSSVLREVLDLWADDASPTEAWHAAEAAARHLGPDAGQLLDLGALRAVRRLDAPIRAALVKAISGAYDTVGGTAVLADIFDGLRDRAYGHARFAEEHMSPASVDALLATLVRDADSILDLACGEGGTLLAAALAARRSDGTYPDVSGWDISEELVAAARNRLFLHGIAARIAVRDSLREPPTSELFDVVVADAPFNMTSWGGVDDYLSDRWRFGTPPATNANFAWLQVVVEKLRPGGRGYVLLPTGSLSSPREAPIRRLLVEAGVVSAVVELPARLYARFSGSVALWCLRAPVEPDPRARVLLVDATGIGDVGRQVTLPDDDVNALAEMIGMWEETHKTTLSLLRYLPAYPLDPVELTSDANLNPRRHINPPETDLEALRAERESAVVQVTEAAAVAEAAMSALRPSLEETR